MKKKCLFISIFLIIILISIVLLIPNKKQKANLETEHIMLATDYYHIKISYPKFHDKIDQSIEKIVQKEKNLFIEEANKNIKKKNTNDFILPIQNKNSVSNRNDFNYEFIISYNYKVINDIYSIRLKIYSYLGENNKTENDIMFYYDTVNRKRLDIHDLVNDEKTFYQIIKTESKQYFSENKQKFKKNKDIVLEKNILDTISFGEDCIFINVLYDKDVFMTYGDIEIPIRYQLVNNYLNRKYFSLDKEISSKENKINQVDNTLEKQSYRDENYFKDKKLVALTFDDGPSGKITERLLDELKKRNARVSFFLLGERVIEHPELVQRIYEEGHTIGSHSYSHKILKNLKDDEVMYQVNETNAALKNITGVSPKYLRPPYGMYSDKILDMVDMSFILWSVDTQDWKKRNTKKVANYIVKHVQDGDIVLLHDLYKTTVNGVIEAIDELTKNGYAFVSIDELVKYKGVTVETHKAYRYFR